ATHRGHCAQEHAARFENPVGVGEGGLHVVDDVQRLDEDEAIVPVRGDPIRSAEVGHDGGPLVGGIDVEDIHYGDGVTPEDLRVSRVLHLQHAAADVLPAGVEEGLDVVTVDRPAAIQTPYRADGLEATEVPE